MSDQAIEATKRLKAFLSDLTETEQFNVGNVSNLTGIEPHALVEILTSAGIHEVSPGVFDYAAALNALSEKHPPFNPLVADAVGPPSKAEDDKTKPNPATVAA